MPPRAAGERDVAVADAPPHADAVIQRHGPSIRQRTTFASGTRSSKKPKRATTSRSSTVTQARSGRTPHRRRNPADRRPMRKA
jgi:hypothetical protein